MIGTLLQW